MQRWHWESCGSHSPGRDPRAVRPRQETVKVALPRCSVPVLPAACRGTIEGGVLQGWGRGDESGQCQGWGSRLTWVIAILAGAPEDKATDQLGQHVVHQTVQQDDSVALGQALTDAARHQGYHVAHLGHSPGQHTLGWGGGERRRDGTFPCKVYPVLASDRHLVDVPLFPSENYYAIYR